MSVLKCKMCGGDIQVSSDMTVGTCQYCGSTMTLPRIDSDKKARLFNRANQYRLNNEFDKAYDAYEAIVEEDEQEAEGYWGMILSEYGVEYVEDPKTGTRIPTCHRTKVQPVRTSVNYKQTIKYSDTEGRLIYQDEAEIIDKLQKNIISVSAKEEPYDVFICYKETNDETGERTKDSVVAQQVYDALQEKGIRTFFSRISLEDKVGQNYEPFIYAALNSAKVLLLVSTSNENCNATWVKNEWIRYIHFMEEDKNKTIVPVCSEMSPYELPDELASFQAQNIDKVGAVQDLVYGVTKLLGKAPRESNNQIINELLDDKASREKKSAFTSRILVLLLMLFALAVGIVAFIVAPGFSNGYCTLGIVEMARRFPNVLTSFGVSLAIPLAVDLVGMIWGLIKGYTSTWPKRILSLGFVLFCVAILFTRSKGYLVRGINFCLLVDLIFIVVFTIIGIKNDKKAETVIRICIILIFAFLGFSSFGYKKQVIANADQITSDDQITVIATFANLRKEASSESEKLGEVYEGMVFDVISKKTEGKYVWYEIKTANGLDGFVRNDLASQPTEVLITDEYINVRSGPGTSFDKIGEVKMGEKYYSVLSEEKGSRIWYKIRLDDETYGYIGAEGIVECSH